MASQEIYASPNLRVFAVVSPSSDRSRIVASFANWHGKQALTNSGAAESLLSPRAIDAIHFNCAGNHWWQYEDLPLALEAARRFVAPWRDIVTYGSSMGGYGAFRYAGALGATRALAVCPQFSIQRALMPQENRWGGELAHIQFRHEDHFQAAPSCQYLALYDTLFALDAMHIREFKRHTPVVDVPLACSGHPPLELLQAYGCLSRVTLELLSGTHEPRLLRQEHRDKRRGAARYWSELGRRLGERRHYRAMRFAFARSIDLAPTKLHLERAIMHCASAGLRDDVTHYQKRLAELSVAA